MSKGKRYKTEPIKKKIKFKPRYLIYILLATILIVLSLNMKSIFAYLTANDQKINNFSIEGTYTVTFNSNSGAGTMNPQVISYNVATNLTANGYTKNGYTFDNWNTESNGSGTTYTNGQSVTNLENITLYAQWNMETYNIGYTLNNGTVATANPETYDVETANFTLNNPSKTGYTFKGWSGTGLTGDTNTSVTISQGSTGDRAYTANWTANTYSIIFNANNGSGTMPNQTMTYDISANLTTNTFTREGYFFAGWNTSVDGSGTSYTDGQSVSNLSNASGGTVTLYAQWFSSAAMEAATSMELYKIEIANSSGGMYVYWRYNVDSPYTVTQTGFLCERDGDVSKELILENIGVNGIAHITRTDNPIKFGVTDKGYGVRMRMYCIVTDGTYTKTIYGEEESFSYAELAAWEAMEAATSMEMYNIEKANSTSGIKTYWRYNVDSPYTVTQTGFLCERDGDVSTELILENVGVNGIAHVTKTGNPITIGVSDKGYGIRMRMYCIVTDGTYTKTIYGEEESFSYAEL